MPYKVEGSVVGNYAVPLLIRALDVITGELRGATEAEAGDTSYSLEVGASSSPVIILATGKIGQAWRPGIFRASGDLCYPIDAETTPYYYKCTRPGYSGQAEPEFVTEPLARIVDGITGCTWELVERIPAPIAQWPIAPTIIL